jgi:NAD(P)-dependent dehydrogenase (short-subunit alcohol dehydrogenase family)
MGQLEGKVAIVTGGASGIGAACAETLAREGARVVVGDIDDAGGLALVDRIKQSGGNAVYRRHDVASEAGWPALIATAEALGGLHIVVANAGITRPALVVDLSLEEWRRHMAINLDGVFLSVKHAIPAMRRSGGGSIVIMSSVGGLRGEVGSSAYCATKGASGSLPRQWPWNALGPATTSASIQFIPGSSTRSSGPSSQRACRRSIHTSLQSQWCRSGAPAPRRTLPTAFCS